MPFRGHNQRLEWLGDTVLQLLVSEYLYRHFPYHNEGHLSLLRTCIVSNRTQVGGQPVRQEVSFRP